MLVEAEFGTEKSVRRRTGAKLRRIVGAGSSRKPGDSTTRGPQGAAKEEAG